MIEDIIEQYLTNGKHPLARIHRKAAETLLKTRRRIQSIELGSNDPFSLGWEFASKLKEVHREILKDTREMLEELKKVDVHPELKAASVLSIISLVSDPYREIYDSHPIVIAVSSLVDPQNFKPPGREEWRNALSAIGMLDKRHKEWKRELRKTLLSAYSILRDAKGADPERVKMLTALFVAAHEFMLHREHSSLAPFDIRKRQEDLARLLREAEERNHRDIARAARKLLEAYRVITEGHSVV